MKVGLVVVLSGPLFGMIYAGELQSEKTGPETLGLHEWSNQKLLETGRHIFDNTIKKLAKQLRAVKAGEIFVNEAGTRVSSFSLPQPWTPLPPHERFSLEIAEALLGESGDHLVVDRRKVELFQEEGLLLNQWIQDMQAVQSAAGDLSSAVEKAKPLLLEIRLRTEDGTLSDRDVPSSIKEHRLSIEEITLRLQRYQLGKKIERGRRELERNATELAEAQTALNKTEDRYTSVRDHYTEQVDLEELAQGFAGTPSEGIPDLAAEAQEERIWLDETLTHSSSEANDLYTQIRKLEGKLNAPPPAVVKKKVLDIQTMDAWVDYHIQQVKTLNALQSALESYLKHHTVLNTDADALDTHLFRMRALARVIERLISRKVIKTKSVPKKIVPGELIADTQRISALVTEAATTAKQAKERLQRIGEDLANSTKARETAMAKRARLKREKDFVKKILEREASIKKFSTEKLLQRYAKNTQDLQEQEKQLDEQTTKLETAQTEVKKAERRLKLLKDPFLLEDSTKDETVEDIVDTEKYQNLLLSRLRTTEKKQRERRNLLEALEFLHQQFQEYEAVLQKTRTLAVQHYANANELKKRVGRRQVKSVDIPKGIAKALKKNRMDELESMMTDLWLWSEWERVGEQIAQLKKLDETQAAFSPRSASNLEAVMKGELQPTLQGQEMGELNEWSNQELLDNGQALLNEARLKLKTDLRAVTKSELLLKEVQKQNASPSLSRWKPPRTRAKKLPWNASNAFWNRLRLMLACVGVN